jgi:excisionase family DNA binding protein
MEARMDAAIVEWVRRVPVDQIPCVLAFLAARLLSEGHAARNSEGAGSGASEPQKLLTARELSEHLGVPESWVRTEERLARIPGVRLGKYVRFKLSEVEQALAERKRQRA